MGFLDNVRKGAEEARAENHQAFVTRCVKRLCDSFNIDYSGVEHEPDFGFGWFRGEWPLFPVHLEARRLKVDLTKLFKDMSKSEPWDLLMTYLDENDVEYAGIIFPAMGRTFYVMHNWWPAPQAVGHSRLLRRAASGDKGVIFESLDAFVLSVRQAGWSA